MSLLTGLTAAALYATGGVQEGGYLIVGSFLGIPPESSIACSLAKRARELPVGLPGLVAWQIQRTATSFGAEAVQVAEGE